jgi:phage/plasmid-like protein (TIGR03299 family)
MVADLDMNKGKARMAYVGEVPWHGLGVKVDGKPTIEKMLKAADLDWQVEKRPIFLEGGVKIENHFALTRDEDDKVFDICGSRYVPVQNAEAFEFFKEFVEEGDAILETAGALHGGKYVWGLANLGESFTLGKGDTVKGYVLVGCPHEQGKSLLIKFTPIRVVCSNTLAMALRNTTADGKGVRLPEFRRAHRSEFTGESIKEAKTALGIAREQLDEFEQTARTLKKMKMGMDDHIDILAPIFGKKQDIDEIKAGRVPPRMQAILDALVNAPGADPKTAWGTLNAVTYWADHVAARTADKRLQNSWFGKTAVQKIAVMDALLRA